jgi:hypothetical protein
MFLGMLLVFVLTAPAEVMAAQPTVNLGTTESFAVLAGSTITNTGTSTITGDIGLSPGTSFTGQSSVTQSGSVHLADAVAVTAKTDLVTAYNDAAGRTPVSRIATELGGTTLKPGVYDSADGNFQITGTLTLDAEGDPDGVFVFKMASTLITASASKVNIINGARFCRIFWQVGSSATLGTNSTFIGHILALESITATTGAKIQGQLLARNGAVTLDTNTITNGDCPITATTTSETTATTSETTAETEEDAAAVAETTSPVATTVAPVAVAAATTETPMPATGDSNDFLLAAAMVLLIASGLLACSLLYKQSRKLTTSKTKG